MQVASLCLLDSVSGVHVEILKFDVERNFVNQVRIMSFFFVWVKKEAQLTQELHQSNSAKVLDFSISQAEGERAIATLTIAKMGENLLENKYGLIGRRGKGGVDVLFQGCLADVPKRIGKNLLQIELKAVVRDEKATLERYEKRLKTSPHWDDLFVSPHRSRVPAEWLDARSELFHWNRVTQKLELSDIFTGRQTLDLSDDIIGQYDLRFGEVPYSQVDVSLSAEWVQHLEGSFDLAPVIARRFSGGIINTLTGRAFKDSWPREGQRLGRSGYYVLESSLREIDPPETGILDLYPAYTPSFQTYDQAVKVIKSVRARRQWLRGKLLLGWSYSQKRCEEVAFTLKNAGAKAHRPKVLSVKLGDITARDPSQSQREIFFQTDRGRKSIEHMIEVAKCHLAMSSRCVEAEIKVPVESAFGITLDHSVTVPHPQNKHQKITGKVTFYKIHVSGKKALAVIRLGFSLGGGVSWQSCEKNLYADTSYGDINAPSNGLTPSGIGYTFGESEIEDDGPYEDLGAEEFIDHLEVRNQAKDQIDHLSENQYPNREDIREVLREVPTVTQILLKDLRTKKVIRRQVPVKILSTWTAPQQVHLNKG